jgi:sulfite oxidase
MAQIMERIPAEPLAGNGEIPGNGDQFLDYGRKDQRLAVLGDSPLVAETPEHLLDDDRTPTEKFFIRNNGSLPARVDNPDAWTIRVDGSVNSPLELCLGEIKQRFQARTHRMVLECGGNGRAFFTPPARGNQWTNGGMGCAEWTGVPLKDVLQAAGLQSSAKFTGSRGADIPLSGDPTKSSISNRSTRTR